MADPCVNRPQVLQPFGRWIGYKGDRFGTPMTGAKRFSYSAPGRCVSDFVGDMLCRQIGYKGDRPNSYLFGPGEGPRRFAFHGECCDGQRTPTARPDCILGGFSEAGVLHVTEGQNCASARCDGLGPRPIYLKYGSGSGTWTTTVGVQLKSGELNFEIDCDSSIHHFKIRTTGCYNSGWIPAVGFNACTDPQEPVAADFQISINDPGKFNCCHCDGADFPASAIELLVQVIFNCSHQIRLARWTGFKGDKSNSEDYDPGEGPKRFALAESCDYDSGCCRGNGCPDIVCDLVASVTVVAPDPDYPCTGGTATASLVDDGAGGWSWQWTIGCLTFSMSCGASPATSHELGIIVDGGATNSGGCTITVEDNLWDTLDVTCDVTMVDPFCCNCTGLCSYRYNAMTTVWEFIGDTCFLCTIACPEHDFGPGTDGEIRTLPCTDDEPPGCCLGTIRIRITR